MHAPIAICMMMVGGYIVPEADIVTIPLKDDLTKGIAVPDMERAKNVALPRVPTLADPTNQSNDGGYGTRNPTLPRSAWDPNASRRPAAMPEAPIGGGNGGFQNPWQPGQGQLGQGQLGQGVGPRLPGSGAGNYYPTPSSAPAGGSAFSPNGPSLNSAPVAGGYGTYAPTRANLATPAQTASKYIASNNGSDIARQYGLPPVSNIGADTGGKAFSNYQAPSGYSPWNNLTLPTNNGTTNPYTAYVKPAMDQQMFNSHISEQINGVQTQQRLYQGTPGYEVPISGAGLANPSQFINYSTH